MLRALTRLLCVLVIASVCAHAAYAQDDETLAQFKKYFKQYKDTPTRVEAIMALQGIESPALVDLLVPILKDADPEVVRSAVRVLASFKTAPPIAALFTVFKNDRTEAVRVGILRAAIDGRYTLDPALVVSLLADKSWEIRRRAIQVLAASRDQAQAAAIEPLCADPEAAVRCEALETLALWQVPTVVPRAIAVLQDPIWQVRTSAIHALTLVRSADSIAPLIDRLAVEEGRLVPEIGEALASLTGKEFGAAVEKWREYWSANEKGFVLPTADAVAYLRAKREAHTGEGKREYYKSGPVAYHGIDTPSRAILFVIDVSGSMEATVVEKERFSDGKYPSYQRIDIVKTELARTIDRLDAAVNFNVIAFATKVDPWKKKLVPANVLNKSAAKDWATRLQAIGGASSDELARVGLAGSANLEMGKTNSYGALMAALNVPQGGKPKDESYVTEVDTIFFLSDGSPSVGEYVDPEDILREVRAANELRKVVIHTIAIGEFQKDFMRKIAEQNGGVFVDLGK